jgi:DNA-binding SARP family transcriptional activator
VRGEGGDKGLEAGTGRIRVRVLGPTRVEVDGMPVHFPPLTAKVLLRLIAAEGEAVAAGQIYEDLWGLPHDGRIGREERNEVQKRVHELRRALEPGRRPGADSPVLRTERSLDGRQAQSAYRLVLGPGHVDHVQFADLVKQALRATPAAAVTLLGGALELWRGTPMADVAGLEFAAPLRRRLTALRAAARSELVKAQADLGHPELALQVAEQLSDEAPDDPGLAELLSELRARARERHAGDVLRRELPGLGITLVVRQGDLFDQRDANLAIGFSDTFDTDTGDDVVISRESVQGQLLSGIYAGERGRLDADLRRGLRGASLVAQESRQDKPRGKRKRYAMGTVAPVPLDGRRIFAFVHCRQDLDLTTHSTARELRHSLDQLWRSVRVHGLLKPVAIPVIGAGLARITGLRTEQLMIMIIDTFVASCRDGRCAPELRIVIRPAELGRLGIPDVARFIEALDQDGQGST